MVMVVGMCVAHVKRWSLFSFGFGAAIRCSQWVGGVSVSVSLHQVALCWRWPKHELHFLSPWLKKELRVLVGVIHATAVHAGLAGFGGRLCKGRGPNLRQGSDTVAARKLTLHTDRVHICMCLQRKKIQIHVCICLLTKIYKYACIL